MSGDNVTVIPCKERDSMQAAMDELSRIMPKQAALGMVMKQEFEKAGFTDDEALQLVAYALFK